MILFYITLLLICDLIFLGGGSTNSPCSETYAGNAPFSEIETKSMSEYINSISDKFYAYLAFHSYSQLLLFPYGHTSAHLDNYNDMVSNCKRNIALRETYNKIFIYKKIVYKKY